MQHGEEELAARAKGAVKSFTTRLQHQTDELTTRLQHQTEELKKGSSRVALVAIRKARASLGRWDSVVAAWGKQEENAPPESDPAPDAAEATPDSPAAPH
jgi:hypothetical protein